jgi:hypothetical protein
MSSLPRHALCLTLLRCPVAISVAIAAGAMAALLECSIHC